MDMRMWILTDGNVVLKLVGIQLIVAVFILFFLKKALDRELYLGVVEKIALVPDEKALAVRDVVVVMAGPLTSRDALRLRTLIAAKFPEARIVEGVDRALWGGVVVRVGGDILDGCLSTRINRLFRTPGA